SIIVIFIAIWMASYLSNRLQWLINGITEFQQGHRDFRFDTAIRDEFGQLALSFDVMAESVVHSVHTPLVITDLNLNIIYANEPCLEVMRKKREEVIGQSYKTISVYGYGSECCPITALYRGGEAGVLHLKGAGKFIHGTANYFIDERGIKRGYIITSSDVTELSLKQIELQRAKEEAELASQHKSRFLSRMSHELRTPMNAIIGINEITQSKIGNIQNLEVQKELNDNLSHLKTTSHHLLLLLNDILEASNLESGAVTLVNTPLELSAMLDRIVTEIKLKCEEKKLNLTTHFDFTSTHFITDGLRLNQALSHLLNNAVKYTPEYGKISFSVKEKEHKDGKVLFSFVVKDTGVGVPENNKASIFLPFEQVENVKYTSGSGLGLAIIKKVLELFGTDIVLKSEPGKGSEFSFDIWFDEDEVSDRTYVKNIENSFAGQKALVVDDVHLNRVVLVNLLREAGFKVDEAKDGKEALEVFEQSPENTYSVIFMDIQMPIMDGYEAAAAIRRLPRPDAKTVTIVAISANAFKEDVDKSIENGMNAHYAKPVQKDSLAKILITHCTPTK
ncbi:MAG: response regulator, partial [Planctomycetaceae bacterium]|nr:response regulator [Planctomycetaceae bacterium]